MHAYVQRNRQVPKKASKSKTRWRHARKVIAHTDNRGGDKIKLILIQLSFCHRVSFRLLVSQSDWLVD